MKKVCLCLAAAIVLFFACAACAAPLKVALLISGRVGDETASFNDICVSGLNNAQKHFAKKITTRVFNSLEDKSKLQDTLDETAARSDVVIVVDAAYLPYLKDISETYPSVKFITLDPTDVPNVKQAVFREEEGAFLAGALAALMTTQTDQPRINGQKVVGIVLGPDVPSIRRFERGYVAGAWYVDKDVRVLAERTDSFSDAVMGEAKAKQLAARGADVIFAAAGAAGLGVVQAAAGSRGFWVIGADSELETKYGDDVLTSVVKRSDLLISRIIEACVKKQDDDRSMSVGLAEEGIDISFWTREAKKNIPLSMRNRVNEISDKIKAGLIIIK
jgi:basic membrane protein A